MTPDIILLMAYYNDMVWYDIVTIDIMVVLKT